ncbi:Tm-1-like ATP-binding domain-containing protein [Georgenia sp. SYP-B2076]|uniref:Tm-1-like ATP-binding domain-containing protein n=1 Tax=Georgenia sp. SYP-B2076 TaxID=2495881 RepID=UPI000F8C3EB1|nr:Tm-1-like ATP-binding domain-containing protein [Georgenia sp. SYP-B2076]
MTAAPRIAVLATLDTKSEEAAFLRAVIGAEGGEARVVDIGLGAAAYPFAAVGAPEVARAAGRELPELRAGLRGEAMAAMGRGAGRLLVDWYARGELDGAIAVGGNQGTAIASIAMRQLPIGPPKLIISTVASGNVRSYVMDSDIAMQFSVADLLGGPNLITTPILRRSAAGIVAMARAASAETEVAHAPAVAVTAFGNTEQAVVAAVAEVRAAGLEVIPFHASGACGSAMERLVDEGRIQAVLDLTTHEVLGELHPEDIYAPVRPGRLTAAGRAGIPQVVVPGGLEYLCFGGVETIPPRYRGRPTHIHNPYNTNVRTTAEELAAVGRLVAERLNAATGPVAVLIPLRGWSHVGSPGGVLHDPAANAALVAELRARLRPDIPLELFDLTINDQEFAHAAAHAVVRMMAEPSRPPIPAQNPMETS